MTQHDPLVRVRHMVDYATEAIEMLGERTPDEVESDGLL